MTTTTTASRRRRLLLSGFLCSVGMRIRSCVDWGSAGVGVFGCFVAWYTLGERGKKKKEGKGGLSCIYHN